MNHFDKIVMGLLGIALSVPVGMNINRRDDQPISIEGQVTLEYMISTTRLFGEENYRVYQVRTVQGEEYVAITDARYDPLDKGNQARVQLGEVVLQFPDLYQPVEGRQLLACYPIKEKIKRFEDYFPINLR